jgi:hypothetical protein
MFLVVRLILEQYLLNLLKNLLYYNLFIFFNKIWLIIL